MVKFLSGTSYDGSQVPVCTYWSTKFTTDKTEDLSPITGPALNGNCIANHYFAIEDISCFNDGLCNSEGKCLPCTKYKYGEGMRMGISHSPPLEFFREFNNGLTDSDLASPQLSAVGSSVQTVYHTQLPFHIIIKNIQAEIAKCCKWSGGDGSPSQFVITPIIDGPDTIQITGADGGTQTLKGIRVKNDAFPQDQGTSTNPEGGSFFPVGLAVVAGWADAPSFYLEPRTGLVKPGEGVVFNSSSNSSTINSQAKSIAQGVPSITDNALSSIDYCINQAAQISNDKLNFLANISQSSAPQSDIDSAQASYDASFAAYQACVDAKTAAVSIAAAANSAAAAVISSTEQSDVSSNSATTSTQLSLLAAQVDIANTNSGGQPASDTAAVSSRQLVVAGQSLQFAGRGGSTKCELAFTDINPALQWNSPTDGSLPCNGMRSDCTFYTGPTWQYATTENLEMGKKITAEAIQELRFYSDDWSRYTNPQEVFNNRFSIPFIWAYKDFVDAGGIPDISDMELYRPSVLLARESPGNLTTSAYETMRVEKVELSNFTNLEFQKTVSPITPGSEGGSTAHRDSSTMYASKISEFKVPSTTRLKITHPPTDSPFTYRIWTPEYTNRISLFGSASPGKAIYLVNNTALKNRNRYHTFFGTKNMFDIPPDGLPGAASDFNGIISTTLLSIFDNIAREKASNQSQAVLGYDEVSSSTTGFWESRVEVDLVHNAINDIYAFIFIDSLTFVFEKVQVDCRLIHSIMKQDSFTATDFTIHDQGGKTTLGIATADLQKSATIRATPEVIFGTPEAATLKYGYYAWQFKDRGLRFSSLNAGSDLNSGYESTSGDDTSYVTETDANAFITNVSYRVVQYRNTETISNWYLLQDCGLIMAAISDPEVNRVLPLADQSGNFKPLSPVLTNNGATGSVVAQWAPEKVTLTTGGSTKDLVLIYRNEEGIGLPANYAIYGPAPGSENQFGRPDPTIDTLSITYTYLRAQTHKKKDADAQTSPQGTGDVVNENFYGDKLREHNQLITIDSSGLTSGSTSIRDNTIGFDQQDFVFVFADSENRPIGKKHVRFMVAYYNLACVSVEIFYAWRSDCMTYALFPDQFLATGGSNGQVTVAPKATINPDDLSLGHLVSDLLGPTQCSTVPNCGDHEILRLGPVRKEFETVVSQTTGEGEDAVTTQKAVYPSAGGAVTGNIVYSEAPGTQWQLKRGTLWYPYDVCEKPRYNTRVGSIGDGNSSTEIINETLAGAGVPSGDFGEGTFNPGPGVQGGLVPTYLETHHVYDEVSAKILAIHSTLRACQSSYTYGNTVSLGGGTFVGYGRRRGEVDQFWYEAAQWSPPPFGNFGRPVLMLEASMKIGDYTPKAESVAFRWMPMFPEREDMGANVSVFSESLEPITLRLTADSCPAGGLGEVAPVEGGPRYTHKSLITNRGGGGIEYPYAPYYPTFLPDFLLGQEPENQGVSVGEPAPKGAITTAWAWRESSTPIKRAQGDTSAIIGMKFLLPEYFLDNRRMEVRLRPAEGNYQISYSAPEYDESGALITNAIVQLGDGPPREIIIDFINRKFGPAPMPETIYDTSKLLGEGELICTQRASSNRQLTNECSCVGSVDDLPNASPSLLPAIFIHADQLAPSQYIGLYSTDEMGPAFPTDIPREDITDPCCMCNYFIEHIYFSLDSSVLPIESRYDPAFSNTVATRYTWSRVPHGIGLTGRGVDDIFAATENRAQVYLEKQGVLLKRPSGSTENPQKRLDKNLITAYFPSTLEASENVIPVNAFTDPNDPKLLGGVPALGGRSRGEDEQITLDVTFDTYVSIKAVRINFLAGNGLEVPTVALTGIPAQNRTGSFVTTRSGRVLGESSTTSVGTSVPNTNNRLSSTDIQNGEALLESTIVPAYGDLVFWDQYYQEFHLIFARRSTEHSMGIYSIEFEIDSLTATVAETIFIPERRYYTSSFTPAGGNNPEENLTGMDSCSAYWRNSTEGSLSGGNRFRSYSWGPKVNQESGVGQGGSQPTINLPIDELEQLQKKEYDLARALFSSPYTYLYSSFFPLSEQNWINFLGGAFPTWSTRLSVTVSDIDKISTSVNGEDRPLYGSVPSRDTWSAPGHAWKHIFEEDYRACCEGCGQSQVIGYNFAHLHDGLAEVETAGFWADFSNGPSFGSIAASVPSITNNPDVKFLETSQFTDANGNPIPVDVLNASGFRRDVQTGQLILVEPVETPGAAV